MTAPEDASGRASRPVATGLSGADWGMARQDATVAAAAAADSFAVAETERYEEGGILGRGGMGVVHAVLDRRLGRLVARKKVLQRSDTPGQRARLAQEVAITARLDHPGIVPVYDAGIDAAGEAFYTMRLVSGRTLAEAIAQTPGLDDRLRLLRRMLAAIEAVAHAHECGIVHRDCKPANILIGGIGETLVADWGLACDVLPRAAAESGAATRVGTPGYRAPEVEAGHPATRQSDVYSLGVSLAELLAGRSSAAADAAGGAVLRGAPPELAAIIARATALNPQARYADAGALAADVEAYLDGRLVAAHRYSAWDQVRRLARAWRAPLAVAAGSLVLLAGAAVQAFHSTAVERDRAVLAEKGTLAALRRADRDLGRALLESARTAAVSGLLPEAEVIAAHALRLGEEPAVRGILMGARVQTVVRAGDPTPLPDACRRLLVGVTGSTFVCLDAGAVRYYTMASGPGSAHPGTAGAKPTLRWQVAGHAQGGAVLEAGVVLTRGPRDDVVLDATTGALRHRMSLERGHGVWLAADATGTAVRFAVDGFAVVDAVSGRVTSAATCDGRGTVAVARAPQAGNLPGAVAAVCDTGRVELFDASGLPVGATATELGIHHRSASAAWWSRDGARLFIGTHNGTVGAFAMPAVEPLYAVRADVGQVRQFAGDADRVVVVGERGGAEVWNQRSGVVLARLPSVAGRTVAMAPQGDVLTFSATVQAWRLPASTHPLRLPGGARAHGLASLALSPDGTQLALSRADGTVLLVQIATGTAVMADQAQDGVSKFAAWSQDGSRLAAVGAQAPGLALYEAASGWRRQEAAGVGGQRRVAILASGALVLAPYAAGLHVTARPGQGPAQFYAGAVPGEPQVAFVDLAVTADLLHGVAVDAAGGVHRIDDGLPVRFARVAGIPGAEVAAVDPAGVALAVAGATHVVVLGAHGEVVRSLQTGGERIHDIAWSADGRLIAIAETTGHARVLDAASLRVLAVLAGHDRRVSAVSFDRATRWLATSSWDGSALLWDVDTLYASSRDLQAQAEERWNLSLAAALGHSGSGGGLGPGPSGAWTSSVVSAPRAPTPAPRTAPPPPSPTGAPRAGTSAPAPAP